MLLTIGKAAKEWGVSRQTIYNKIKEGEISYSKDDKGTRQIDSSELARVFGSPKESNKAATSTPNSDPMVDLLREQLEKTEKRLERVEESLQEKDRALIELMETVQANMQLFLGHQPSSDKDKAPEPEVPPIVIAEAPKPEPAPTAPTPPTQPEKKAKRGLFQRLASAAFDLD